jgi:hypothetical protein
MARRGRKMDLQANEALSLKGKKDASQQSWLHP